MEECVLFHPLLLNHSLTCAKYTMERNATNLIWNISLIKGMFFVFTFVWFFSDIRRHLQFMKIQRNV